MRVETYGIQKTEDRVRNKKNKVQQGGVCRIKFKTRPSTRIICLE
jgi:hypothetical protein